MNWAHLRAFVWLRWRLMANQWRRAGALSAALLILVTISAAVAAIPAFVGAFFLAIQLIPKATPAQLMYAWDGLIAAFLMFWSIGLLTDLQRNDPLSLSKFLHLPVSVNSAFLINYLSSLAKLSLLFFGPLMAAYALALVYVQGVAQLPVLPSLAAFFLLVTAPTYQFQGWLAALVSNPRRRRAVVVGATMTFVLIFQLPNLVNVYLPRQRDRGEALRVAYDAEVAGINRAAAAREIDALENARRQKDAYDRHRAEVDREDREESAKLARIVRVANMAVPFGWLPLGVMGSAEGRVLPSLLGLAGMTLIGSASLRRAYRTTLDQFRGKATSRKGRAPEIRAAEVPGPRGRMLEARLPGLSEPVSAIALAGFKTLLRSPEAKIALLMPLIMGAIFGSMLLRGRATMPEASRPLLGSAAIAFVLFAMLQLMGNQFGMDRDGFRVFVLSAAPRRDILLGKNLVYLPAALGIATVLLVALQALCPMRPDHLLAMAPQFVSMYLMFCLIANLFSICAPMHITAGTLKPANPKFSMVLLQMSLFIVLFPLSQGLTMIPIGVEAGLHALGRAEGWPVCLGLALAECAGIVALYRLSLGWFGALLQSRERRILETVTNRAL